MGLFCDLFIPFSERGESNVLRFFFVNYSTEFLIYLSTMKCLIDYIWWVSIKFRFNSKLKILVMEEGL